MSWYQTKKANKLLNMSPSSILVFDLETTGVNSSDEILQISIVDGLGNNLFTSYVKPLRHKTWEDAEKINHISPDTVASAPYFKDIKKNVQSYFNKAKLIVGYNSKSFDIPFIEKAGIVVPQNRFDVREEFCLIVGRRWDTKLLHCASYFGHSYSPHDAQNDAVVTALCFQDMIHMPEFALAESSETKKEEKKAPQFFLKKHKFRPFIIGLIIMLISLVVVFFRTHLNPFSFNLSPSEWQALKDFFSSDLCCLICGGTFIVGLIFTIIGIVKAIIRIIRWIINLFRKIF